MVLMIRSPSPITTRDRIARIEGEQGEDEGVAPDGRRGKHVLCNHQPTLRGSVLILVINKRRQGDSILKASLAVFRLPLLTSLSLFTLLPYAYGRRDIFFFSTKNDILYKIFYDLSLKSHITYN